jgi:hypothetical protein
MLDLDVPAAAKRLGVHPSRVRALLLAGDLKGRKLGSRWLVDAYASDERAHSASVVEGRAFSAPRAWGLLALLSGDEAPWLDPSARSRLRARLAQGPVQQLLPRLRRRAQVHHLRAPAPALKRIRDARGFIASGVSAGDAYDVEILAPDQVEGYIDARRLRELRYQLALESVDPPAANVVLRVPAFPGALKGRRIAPAGVVAVDLMESPDQRSQRAGRQLAERLRRDRAQAK